MMKAVEEAIVNYGIDKFRDLMKMEVLTYIELIELYLLTTVVKNNKKYYRQKKGVCIGSRLASYLSDIYLAKVSRMVMQKYRGSFDRDILELLRFVDDLLIVGREGMEINWLVEAFQELSVTLKFTTEETKNGMIKFLDLLLYEKGFSGNTDLEKKRRF
jgi:hypothetical protein